LLRTHVLLVVTAVGVMMTVMAVMMTVAAVKMTVKETSARHSMKTRTQRRTGLRS
jgi:hypothetical protein